jgi:hypothetical protein
MNKVVKKMFLAVITLLLAVVTFTGVTFAWLSINSDAWVEGMQIQATAGKGFMVSVDGVNYQNSLTTDDIMKAIVAKYRKTYILKPDGTLLDEEGRVLSKEQITKVFKQIELEPCTSYNTENLDLTNIYGTKIDASKGQYIEFDIYFKSTGELVDDMNIYVNGLDKVMNQDSKEINVNPTRISSNIDEIKLQSSLITYNKETGESIQKQRDDKLNVKSSNATRLGIINQQNEMSILELTDEYDLGSYATNIAELVDKEGVNIVYNALYDARKNAMYTYSSQMVEHLQPIDYTKTPKTIKSLVNSQGVNTVRICSLTKEDSTQKATFKLWLEGWDADCIDGLKQSISVQLSFVQQ